MKSRTLPLTDSCHRPHLSSSMTQVSKAILTACLTLLLAGCAEVVPAGPDTFSVSTSGAGFSDKGCRARVYQKANEYCQSRGLVMMPLSLQARGGIPFTRPPSADLVFRALKPGDPELKRPAAAQVQNQE